MKEENKIRADAHCAIINELIKSEGMELASFSLKLLFTFITNKANIIIY